MGVIIEPKCVGAKTLNTYGVALADPRLLSGELCGLVRPDPCRVLIRQFSAYMSRNGPWSGERLHTGECLQM